MSIDNQASYALARGRRPVPTYEGPAPILNTPRTGVESSANPTGGSAIFGKKNPSGTGHSQQGTIVPQGYSYGQLSNELPENRQLFQQLHGLFSPESYYGKIMGGDEKFFNQLEAPLKRQFGRLQESYGNQLAHQNVSGSARENAQTLGAQEFAESLAGQRQNLQQNAMQGLQSLASSLLGYKPNEGFFVQNPKEELSFFKQLALAAAPGLAEGLGSGVGDLLGGPFGWIFKKLKALIGE